MLVFMTPALDEKLFVESKNAFFSIENCQIITLTLQKWDLEEITQSLQHQLKQAPDFYRKTSILISFDMLEPDACDLDKMNMLVILMQHYDLDILACTGPLWVKDLCRFFNIPYFKNAQRQQAEANVEHSSQKASFSLSLPVRPGQQYARQGDLIILASVHPGGEVLATGHIHAYGRTQGRLLAGINGAIDAQIFCTSLQAELISIAGVFLTKDLYPKKWLNQPCRIFLSAEQRLQFESLS